MEEIWKDIEDYEGYYMISNLGNVKSLSRLSSSNKKLKTKILKGRKNDNGYLFVRLFKNGYGKQIAIHRLVAIVFIENNQNKLQVNHIDGDKVNNCIDNLEWVTASENIIHAFKIGLKENSRISARKNVEKAHEVRKVKVICINDSMVFDSVKSASIHYGLYPYAIIAVCKGKFSATKGYKFSYYEDSL